MAMVNSIQPENLATTPIGNPAAPVASGDLNTVSKPQVTQEIVKTKAELNDLKNQEVDGQISETELDSQMADLNAQLNQLQNYLKFERDEDSENMVIFIKNSETDEIIRQIPSQEFLAVSKSIGQYLEMSKQVSEKISPPVGMLTNETV